jgi:hypothetical protein
VSLTGFAMKLIPRGLNSNDELMVEAAGIEPASG